MGGGSPAAPASGKLELTLAFACGATVANLYVAQPLLGDIAASLGLPLKSVGLVITLAQLGYGVGLLFIVPLGDLVENRWLSVNVLSVAAFAASVMALTTKAMIFLVAAFFLGLGLVTVQILLPYAASLADPMRQGAVVGRIMAGILAGIMLSRPFSGFLADLFGWRIVFAISAFLCIAVIAFLLHSMPPRLPPRGQRYSAVLKLLWDACRHDTLLQRRAAYQFLMFYSYTLFWTVLPLLLAREPYLLGHWQIGAVALAGAAGVVLSPVAGHIADRGLVRAGTIAALAAGTASWGLGAFSPEGGLTGLIFVILAALVLDGAVPVSLVLSQRELFAANPQRRATYNGLFMAIFFAGGALGASIGVWTFETFGWIGSTVAGAAGPAMALAFAVTSQTHVLRQHQNGETK